MFLSNWMSWVRLASYQTSTGLTTPSQTILRTRFGVQRAVDLAEIGAVGEAVVVDLACAERLADALHVADQVGRLHVAEQGAARGAAVAGILPGLVPPRVQQPSRLRDKIGAGAAEVGAVTAQRGLAGADAAGIEADPVVGVAAVAGHGLTQPRQRQPGAARTTRIDQHDALGVRVGGLVHDPRDRDLDLRPVGLGVVQRHSQQAALRACLLQRGTGALAPGDRRWRVLRCAGARGAGRGGVGGGGAGQAGDARHQHPGCGHRHDQLLHQRPPQCSCHAPSTGAIDPRADTKFPSDRRCWNLC